jgi:hypothetical protein
VSLQASQAWGREFEPRVPLRQSSLFCSVRPSIGTWCGVSSAGRSGACNDKTRNDKQKESGGNFGPPERDEPKLPPFKNGRSKQAPSLWLGRGERDNMSDERETRGCANQSVPLGQCTSLLGAAQQSDGSRAGLWP